MFEKITEEYVLIAGVALFVGYMANSLLSGTSIQEVMTQYQDKLVCEGVIQPNTKCWVVKRFYHPSLSKINPDGSKQWKGKSKP